jgi:hypothetical protein
MGFVLILFSSWIVSVPHPMPHSIKAKPNPQEAISAITMSYLFMSTLDLGHSCGWKFHSLFS